MSGIFVVYVIGAVLTAISMQKYRTGRFDGSLLLATALAAAFWPLLIAVAIVLGLSSKPVSPT